METPPPAKGSSTPSSNGGGNSSLFAGLTMHDGATPSPAAEKKKPAATVQDEASSLPAVSKGVVEDKKGNGGPGSAPFKEKTAAKTPQKREGAAKPESQLNGGANKAKAKPVEAVSAPPPSAFAKEPLAAQPEPEIQEQHREQEVEDEDEEGPPEPLPLSSETSTVRGRHDVTKALLRKFVARTEEHLPYDTITEENATNDRERRRVMEKLSATSWLFRGLFGVGKGSQGQGGIDYSTARAVDCVRAINAVLQVLDQDEDENQLGDERPTREDLDGSAADLQRKRATSMSQEREAALKDSTNRMMATFVDMVTVWCTCSSSGIVTSLTGSSVSRERTSSTGSGTGAGVEEEERNNATTTEGTESALADGTTAEEGEEEEDDDLNFEITVSAPLLSLAIDTTERLVAYGCFDALLGVPHVSGASSDKREASGNTDCMQLVSQAICRVDLCTEQMELSALKFLLTTGCRVPRACVKEGALTPGNSPTRSGSNKSVTEDDGGAVGPASSKRRNDARNNYGAMLHGKCLLLLIRMAYHVYLKTQSEPNRTTARAALQQLITGVFQRMERTSVGNATGPGSTPNTPTTAASSTGTGGSKDSTDGGGIAAVDESAVLSQDLDMSVEYSLSGDMTFDTPRTSRKRITSVPGMCLSPSLSSKDEAGGGSAEKPRRKRGGTRDFLTQDSMRSFGGGKVGSGGFATPNHLDAFLALRSLCKLSMKPLPEGTFGSGSARVSSSWDMHGGMGSIAGGGAPSTPASHATSAAASKTPGSPQRGASSTEGGSTPTRGDAGASADSLGVEGSMSNDRMLISPTSSLTDGMVPIGDNGGSVAPHPALQSKILALELLLYVLEHAAPKAELFLDQRFSFAIRNYLCVSLLKNCTSNNTQIVGLSLRLFVPIIQHFRAGLKTEIEAFVTNVFFVILDSSNSTVEHKSLVVTLFNEICSDEATLAEIFLNYDCDLSAVDLFHRIVTSLARVASKRTDDDDPLENAGLFVAGGAAARSAALRQANRELRLNAMGALRQILESLNETVAVDGGGGGNTRGVISAAHSVVSEDATSVGATSTQSVAGNDPASAPPSGNFSGGDGILGISPGSGAPLSGGSPLPQSTDGNTGQKSLVEIYDSKKRLREQENDIFLRFNQKPSAGLKYAGEVNYIDAKNPTEVARFFLQNKDRLEKTQIGEYLGREADYQGGFALQVLHEYVEMLDFTGLVFDEAIRHYLAGFRLPGEAQKIDRIMEKFAERFCLQNPSVFPSADAAFILAFSVIMLNTDLHNPAIKEERRMTKEGFRRNNRGICDGGDLPEEFLDAIFDRIQSNPISLKEDDEARKKAGVGGGSQPGPGPSSFFVGAQSYDEIDRDKKSKFLKERDQILRNTQIIFQQRKGGKSNGGKGAKASKNASNGGSSGNKPTPTAHFVRTSEAGLKDEYVIPMFEVTWGPSLAVFSTAMESASSGISKLKSIATEQEIDLALDNLDATTDVCLTGFRLAICTAGLCGNETARGAFVHALLNFSRLGSGRLLEDRHIHCVQALLQLAREDGEILGGTWEHIFKALAEITRLRQVHDDLTRNSNARRKNRVNGSEDGGDDESIMSNEDMDSLDEDDFYLSEDEMDRKAIDEANARALFEAVPEELVDEIYHRSSFLSPAAVMDFIFQLCRVSRMEIAGYGGHVGSRANFIDLDAIDSRDHPSLLPDNGELTPSLNHQPIIHSLQKLVEVSHYNMESRPRLVFSEIWTTVSSHLTSTALHSNPAVAMYAVDSFRQLGIQFLQREELGMFEFQRKFLRPLETIMERSCHSSTKELLLSCVEQIIIIFGEGSSSKETSKQKKSTATRGTLRSGWRAILSVLGLAGHDVDDNVARFGFKLLDGLVNGCVKLKDRAAKRRTIEKMSSSGSNGTKDQTLPRVNTSMLMMEHFVDLVDALLMFVSGSREDLTLEAIDHLVHMSSWLADEKIPLPLLKSKSGSFRAATDEPPHENSHDDHGRSSELELWWPILLGLSRSSGDARMEVRHKCLTTLMETINKYFIPPLEEADSTKKIEEGANGIGQGTVEVSWDGEVQTLRLIFKGILTPTLEHAEMDVNSIFSTPQIPDDFSYFIAQPVPMNGDAAETESWLGSTFDPLMDGCVAICLRSIELYKTDALVEEVLAMLNSCLVSDSGALAVRGLRRLHVFITRDLDRDHISGDTWATACHMLLRCLMVRSVPGSPDGSDHGTEDDGGDDPGFEGNFLLGKRYIPSNATMVIGKLLCDGEYASSMGLPWYIFLMAGLGRGVREWESAAAKESGKQVTSTMNPPPPHHLENCVYGQKWIVQLLLTLAAMEDVDETGQLPMTVQNIIKEETQSFLTAFLNKESTLGSPKAGDDGMGEAYLVAEVGHLTSLVCDLLGGYNKLDDNRLFGLPWLCPMLTSLIQSNNKAVRVSVHSLVSRMFEGRVPEKSGANPHN